VTKEQFIAPASFPFGGLHGTLLHILDAEYGWRTFFETNSFVEDLDGALFSSFESLKEQWAMEEQAMRAYLNGLTDEDMVSHRKYINDEGIHRDRILWHCLIHVVNHGSQHRSEAAALLTDFGCSPGDLDFTLFLIETGNS
jgi:uncharacterized damage-inducible protein DinB